MHFKLDENADPRWRLPLEHAGHFVSMYLKRSYPDRMMMSLQRFACKSGSRS